MDEHDDVRICENCRVITVLQDGRWVHPAEFQEKFSDHVCAVPIGGRGAKLAEQRWGRGRPYLSDKRTIFATIPELAQDPSTPVTIGVDGSYKPVMIGERLLKPMSWAFISTGGSYGLGTATIPGNIVGEDKPLQGELRAIWWALTRTPETHPVTIVTDSAIAQWLMECWRHGVMKMPAGYTTERISGREATLVRLAKMVHESGDRIDARWVRGHTGDPLNEGANAMARMARAWATDRLTKAEVAADSRRAALSSLIRYASLL